ncbi:hypothetical protein [Desulfosporosinus sp. BG]|uniref:hypothetical protein n=1 Tax=Desulfosporosinus sp. BG TaxID=1633135 RepID=UPI00083A2AA7|nr:hypothetical protein [Desulfosporosinus sp. BG]ODA40373.1 hypothetical protein DSBG_2795 [Desulfosporosinus sp. BG]
MRFIDVPIIMYYETQGKQKCLEFYPVSYSTLKNSKEVSFGIPQKVQKIIKRKSFKLIEIPCRTYDGLNLQYTEMGRSVNNENFFLHFKPFR